MDFIATSVTFLRAGISQSGEAFGLAPKCRPRLFQNAAEPHRADFGR
jgi:hypothetical protein